MPRGGTNRKPTAARRQYFELVRQGLKGAAAARQVGVSTSCGSKWFIEAGSMIIPDVSVSPRFLTQDDRIAIADGPRTGKPPTTIAAVIGKSTSTVYREIARRKKEDGSYAPWWAQNQALLRRQRPKTEKIRDHAPLRIVVREKIDEKWSPQQISRYLRRQYPDEPQMHACAETIYRGLFAGLLGRRQGRLRTGRTRRKKQRRGVPSPNKIKNMTLIRDRPTIVNERSRPGDWEGDLIIGRGQRSAIGDRDDGRPGHPLRASGCRSPPPQCARCQPHHTRRSEVLRDPRRHAAASQGAGPGISAGPGAYPGTVRR
jgi:transposase